MVNARLTILLAAAMAIAALAAGCGGSGDDASGAGGEGDSEATTVAASSLSKTAFLQQANGICTRGALQAVEGEPPNGEPAPETISAQVEVLMVPAFTQVAEEIQQLGAPKGGETTIESFLAALYEDIGSLEKQSASMQSLDQVQRQFEASSDIARPYGLYACAYYKRPHNPKQTAERRAEHQAKRRGEG